MTRRSAAHHYRLLTYVNLVAAEAGTPSQRLKRLARLFSSPREHLTAVDNGLAMAAELDHLCEPLVFMVLNVPATFERDDERVFVAVLDPNAEPPAERTGIVPTEEGDDHTDVLFFERDAARVDGDRTSELARRWRAEWKAYSDITRTLQRQGIFTWNQFLLHGCRFPETLGLVWRHPAQWPYVALDEELVRHLRLPSLTHHDGEWRSELLNTPAAPLELDGGVTATEARLRAMHPRSNVDAAGTAAHATYHLARSYAIWGGNAFVSLPVLLGVSTQMSAVAVLSLCSRSPLDEAAILAWHSMAVAAFAPVNAAELASYGSLRERLRALEGTGHALKWAAELTAWEPVTQRLHAELSKAAPSSVGLIRMAASSLQLVSLIQGLGNLVRVVGAIAKGHIDKLAEWHDDVEHSLWEDGDNRAVVSAYADLAFALGRVVCFGTAWSGLRVDVIGEGAQVREWKADQSASANSFAPSMLRVPPFRMGSDAVYVLIAALGEPMTNATDAMKREQVPASEPLRVRLRANLPDEVLIEVGNVTKRRVDGLPPGVRDTQALIGATGIASYGRPYRDPSRSDLLWVPLHVHALGLSQRIRGATRRAWNAGGTS